MTPVYRATVTLAPVDSDATSSVLMRAVGQLGSLASLAGIDIGGGSKNSRHAVAILKSKAFTHSFIEEEGVLYVLYSDLWDAESGRWLVESDEEQPSAQRAFRMFDEKIRTVQVDEDTGLVTLAIEWRDPEIAAAWANRMVAKLNQYARERAINEARRSIEYLEQELKKTNLVGVESVIYRLIETQLNNIMLAEVRDEYAFRIIDPAVAPLPDQFVRPKRVLMVVVAAFLSFACGVFIATVKFLVARSYAVSEIVHDN